jgi:hypothetical protein
MSKTPDEIKKGLECRIRSYRDICNHRCDTCDLRIPAYSIFSRYDDALALIQRLEAENAEQAERIRQLEAERDAAVADINVARSCRICRNLESDPVCAQCSVGGRNFEWRGLKKEATT